MLVRFILVLFSPSHIIKVGDKVKARRNCQQQVVYTTSCYQNKKENESIRKLSKTALTCDVDLCTFGEKWNNKVAMECVIFTLFSVIYMWVNCINLFYFIFFSHRHQLDAGSL